MLNLMIRISKYKNNNVINIKIGRMQQQSNDNTLPLIKAPNSEQEQPLHYKGVDYTQKLEHKANSSQFSRQQQEKTQNIGGQRSQGEDQEQQQKREFYTKQERELLDKYTLSKIFKHMKKTHLLRKTLQSIVSHLVQSETLYLSSLQQLQQHQHPHIQYLISEGILSEDECQNLYGYNLTSGNWNSIFKITKKQLDIMSELLIRKDWGTMLAQLEKMIELYQVYSQEYTKIVNILWIIDMLEQKLLRLMIQGEGNKYDGKRTSTKVVMDHSSSQNVVVMSQIMDEQEIPTKHSKQGRDSKQSDTSETNTNQSKHEKLLNIIRGIRKNILLPINKVSQYIQYITKYMRTFLELYEQLNETIKIKVRIKSESENIQEQYLQQLNNTKHIIKKSRFCIQKFLIILTKILDCNYNQMNEHDSKVVEQLPLLFPEIFYSELELDDKQCKQVGKSSSGYNVCGSKDIDVQEGDDDYPTPFIVSFGTFDSFCMGKPCEIFLVKNHLIVIEDTHPQTPSASMTMSKLKTKPKQIQIHKLCIVQIDHTTNVQIISHNMLYQRQLMYISGGQYSNGVYIQFRGRRMSPDENLMLQKHKKQCDDSMCQLCTSRYMQKWQYMLAESNMHILKTIVQLKVSFSIYVFNCQEIGITGNKQQQILRLRRQTNRMKNIQMRVIKPKPSQQQHRADKNYYLFEDQNIITGCKEVRAQVLAVEYRYEKQDKFYVIRLSIYDYSNCHNGGSLPNIKNNKNGGRASYRENSSQQYMNINLKIYAQTIYISEEKLEHIEEYIFKAFPSMLTVNKVGGKLNHMVNYSIMKLHEYKQLFYKADFENQKIVQFQCMIITDLLNTIFKTNEFKNKPELILSKFGICEGMWQIIISKRFNSYYQHCTLSGKFSQLGVKSKKQCKCIQCFGYSQSSFGQDIDLINGKSNKTTRFWKYYQFTLAFPEICQKRQKIKQNEQPPLSMQKIKKSVSDQQRKKKHSFLIPKPRPIKNRKILKNKKNPICPMYGQKVEFDYISNVSRLIIQSKNKKERLKPNQQIIEYFDKIKYLKYISNGNTLIHNNLNYNLTSIEYDLFNHVIKTGRTKSFTLILYCLPNLHDYYHNLEASLNKKQSKKQSSQLNIFKQIQEQNVDINSAQNHGFTSKLVTNIYKDATCKHVKYIIGRKLGICDQYIAHFMETYALTIVKKQESKKQQSFINSAISKILFSKQQPAKIRYYIREIYILHDFEMIFDVLDRLNQLNEKESEKYYISIKKILKIDPLLILTNKTNEKKQISPDNSSIIQSYEKLLEFELAEIWYRFNQQQILIRQQPDSFLMKYMTLIFSYLLNKLKHKQKYEPWLKENINEKLLIKTGIFSKHLIEQYYNYQLTEINGDEKSKKQIAQKNLQMKNFRRKQLINVLSAQIQSKQDPHSILNRIVRIVYQQTTWTLLIEHIIYIDNLIKDHYSHRHIFVSMDGIVIQQKNAQSQNKTFKENTSIMKSQFKKMKSSKEQTLIQLNYCDINVQMFGSIIAITNKKIDNSIDEKKQPQKYTFFSANQCNIFNIIKFYIAWRQNIEIEDLCLEQSKLKKSFDKQKLRTKTLQQNSRVFMKKHQRVSKRRSQIFGLQDQSSAIKIKLQQQLFSKKKNEDGEN